MKQVQPCSDCLATHGSWLTYGNGSSKIIVDGWILVRNKKTKLNQRGVRMVKLAHKFPIHCWLRFQIENSHRNSN